MKVKKFFENISLTFFAQNNFSDVEELALLENLILSINKFKFINKNKPFNELVKLQQTYKKYVLVDFESNMFDEYRFILKIVENFLIETNQRKTFSLIELIIHFEDKTEIILDDTDIFKQMLSKDCSFSPTIRSIWQNSLLADKILRM